MPLSHPILVLALVVTTAACGNEAPVPSPSADPAPPTDIANGKVGGEVECPVCGLRFDQGESRFASMHSGKRYFFLIEDHQKAFDDDPGTYLPE